MKKQRYGSIWDAIEPSRAEAANMRARAATMIAIQQAVAKWRLTQAATAKTARAHPAAAERSAARADQQVQPRCPGQHRDGSGARGAGCGGEGGVGRDGRRVHDSDAAFRDRTAPWSRVLIRAVLEAREGRGEAATSHLPPRLRGRVGGGGIAPCERPSQLVMAGLDPIIF
jgi:hypothetical protein